MALFKKDQTEGIEMKKESTQEGTSTSLDWVIKKPRITEKAAVISSDNAYTFDVDPAANKIQVKQAIKEQYKVTPVKVTIINKKAHKETRRGRVMHVRGTKKAMVFLKKGDTIEFV